MNQQATHPEKAAAGYLARVHRRLATQATRVLFRRRLTVRSEAPLISFTFDDFPRSAFTEAGSILRQHGALGTYYVSLGLVGKPSPVGPICEVEDLKELARQGHELGCHTFGHCHSWNTSPDEYERAILENRKALTEVLPGASFQTFAYPHSAPRLAVKKVAGRHFRCCRGGGRGAINEGTVDLNLLSTNFLERSRDNPRAVKDLIDQNTRAWGWLVFATHDVCADPSPFGCTPEFFRQVVQWSVDSGARILPVVKALEVLQARPSK